jgi:diacylglycerol O-acyltransferase / wax synthase
VATSSPADEPLSRADAANVQLAAAGQLTVILTAATLGRGGFVAADGHLDVAALRAELGARLRAGDPRLRRLSQRVVERPGSDPAWRACPPDLDFHIRQVSATPGRDGLSRLCSELMTTPLAADRPLWELLLVAGSPDQPAGFVLRFDHCVTDGANGVRLAQLFLTGTQSAPSAAAVPTTTDKGARLRLGFLRSIAVAWPRIGRTPLLGRLSSRHEVAFAEVEFAALSAAARRCGATVNDALLAAVNQGVAAALAERGAVVPRTLRVSVPVALADRGDSGNATGVMVVDLPLSCADVQESLSNISAQTSVAKQAAREQGTFELTRSRWSTRLFATMSRHQRFAALFVTNVRGPEQSLRVAGAEVARLWPVTPLQGNIRLAIAAMSYDGRLGCSVHADQAGVSANAVGIALQRALDDLVATPRS